MKLTTRVTVLVEFELPPETSATRAAEYVKGAVMGWAGGLPEEDPMVDLDRDTVMILAKFCRTTMLPEKGNG